MKKTIVRATIVAVALLSSTASPLLAAVSGNMSDVSATAPLGAISSTIGSSVGSSVGGSTGGAVGGSTGGGTQQGGGTTEQGGGNDQGQGGQNDRQNERR